MIHALSKLPREKLELHPTQTSDRDLLINSRLLLLLDQQPSLLRLTHLCSNFTRAVFSTIISAEHTSIMPSQQLATEQTPTVRITTSAETLGVNPGVMEATSILPLSKDLVFAVSSKFPSI